jgi:hypothetical protein
MKYKLACLGLLLIAAVPAPLQAVLMTPFSVAELTAQSDVVVHGTVVSTTCRRDAVGNIYTSVTLAIEDVLKGSVDTNTFRLIHSGGVLGDEIQSCSAQVEFGIGEEIVAMLVLNERGEGVVLGLVQGKFHVWKDKATGEKFAHNIFHGSPEKEDAGSHNHAAHAHGQAAKEPDTTPKPHRLALNDLKSRIKGGAK